MIFIIAVFIVPLPSIIFFFFFFNDTAPTEFYTLSLHDALPICLVGEGIGAVEVGVGRIAERAVGIQGEAAIGRSAHEDSSERVAVHIGVVGQDAGCSDRQRR